MGTLLFTVTRLAHTAPPEIITINLEELSCLAHNIYHEARGETLHGQMAVAAVTMNRVYASGYPSSICKVVNQKTKTSKGFVCQFSWVCDKRTKRAYGKPLSDAYKVANAYLNGVYEDPTKGALFYHTKAVSPYWSKNKRPVVVIGSHLFYIKV